MTHESDPQAFPERFPAASELEQADLLILLTALAEEAYRNLRKRARLRIAQGDQTGSTTFDLTDDGMPAQPNHTTQLLYRRADFGSDSPEMGYLTLMMDEPYRGYDPASIVKRYTYHLAWLHDQLVPDGPQRLVQVIRNPGKKETEEVVQTLASPNEGVVHPIDEFVEELKKLTDR